MKKLLVLMLATLAIFAASVAAPSPASAGRINCGDGTWTAFARSPSLMSQVGHWRLNLASAPTYLNLTTTQDHARNAHWVWEAQDNWCGFGDQSSVDFTYDGTTTAAAKADGVNTIGWGDITTFPFYGKPSDLAITQPYCSISNCARVTECDIRLNRNYSWSNIGGGQADVWSVIEHEVGHCLGAWHFPSVTNDMYIGQPPPSDLSGRRLGRGDYFFAAAFY